MKSLKYFAISLIIALCNINTYACVGDWYSPQWYFLYRVDIDGDTRHSTDCELNCREWQKLTSTEIPTEDIMYVVYRMPLAEFEKAYNNPNQNFSNKFLEWISKKDRQIMDLLRVAKNTEFIRSIMASKWYYPTMRTGAPMTLEEVAEIALANKEPRLRDRYLLQATRALFALGRYEECIALWNAEAKLLPAENLMRGLIHDYIAGAESNLNRHKNAVVEFAKRGDYHSVVYSAKLAGYNNNPIDNLEIVCQYEPNSSQIPSVLQNYVRKLEPDGSIYDNDEFKITPEVRQLYALCKRMGQNDKCKVPAMWNYTAAFIADLMGDSKEALRLLTLAENSASTPFLDESIAVFRIYMDAKTLPYNDNYERKLFEQLRWLDDKIANNIDDDVRYKTGSTSLLTSCYSYYYWNDMMRRIVLGEVCPRMLKAGKTNRALQLANMACNRLLNLVDYISNCYFIHDENNDYIKISFKGTMAEYRKSCDYNAYDFCNHFFEMIDTLEANKAVQYIEHLENTGTDFDQFLNERGYTGRDYLHEIAGTKMLRELRYQEARHHLSQVDPSFRINTNIRYNPFSVEKKSITPHPNFKLKFARQMCLLEKIMEHSANPNLKAKAMARYAIGIRNSFYLDWGLTQYYYGWLWGVANPYKDWTEEPLTEKAYSKVSQLIGKACQIATDQEVAASIQYQMCNFRTVAKMYPDTPQGRLIKGSCDNLRDYHAERQSY